MRRHIDTKSHKKHVSHRQLHNLDLNLPEPSESEPPAPAFTDELTDLPPPQSMVSRVYPADVGILRLTLTPQDWGFDALSESKGVDSILDSNDDALSPTSSKSLAIPPLPPPPPPLPRPDFVIPEYNFFNDAVYQSFEDDILETEEGLLSAHDPTPHPPLEPSKSIPRTLVLIKF